MGVAPISSGYHLTVEQSLTFVPLKGTLVRSGSELIWEVDGREVVIATRDGGWASNWHMTSNVQYLVSFEKSGRQGYWVSLKLQEN